MLEGEGEGEREREREREREMIHQSSSNSIQSNSPTSQCLHWLPHSEHEPEYFQTWAQAFGHRGSEEDSDSRQRDGRYGSGRYSGGVCDWRRVGVAHENRER